MIGRIIKGSKGLTLVEVLVAMSVGFIGAAGGYALLANTRGTLAGNSSVVQAQQEARLIVESIAREIRESSPNTVWPSPMTDSDYIVFYTPRDRNGKFIMDNSVKPVWQRGIAYALSAGTTKLYRYQSYIVGALPGETTRTELVSSNVERIRFSRNRDMITISVRTFIDRSNKVGHVSRSYADFYTAVKMRN